MKKIIIPLLLLCIVFSMCSCSFTEPSEPETTVTEQTSAETTTRPELKVSLGVVIATALNEKTLKATGIMKYVPDCKGIYVSKMTPDSILDATKFRPGDIIQAINGQETNTLDDIYDILKNFNPGDTAVISAFRINILNGEDQEHFDVSVTFPAAESETDA